MDLSTYDAVIDAAECHELDFICCMKQEQFEALADLFAATPRRKLSLVYRKACNLCATSGKEEP